MATPTSPSVKALMHELHVHQVELEMQNEELRRTQLDLAAARDRYVDLYDFAPVGYVTLDVRGQIVEANLTGAAMLGEPRKTLMARPFAGFVAAQDRERWQQFVEPASWTAELSRIELTLQPRSGPLFHAQLDCQMAGVGASVGDGAPTLRVVLTDITPRKQAEMARHIADTVVQAGEAERRTVARQLHDDLGQTLSALKMALSSQLGFADQPAQLQRVQAMLSLLDESVATVRQIALDLRPLMLDDLGLSEAIDWLVHDAAHRLGLRVTLHLAEGIPPLGEPTATALFRLVQEILTQVAIHGRVSEVDINLARQDKDLVLVAHSSHGGWPKAASASPTVSAGALALHERAHLLNASMALVDEPGGAQQITVRLPLVNVLSPSVFGSLS